MGDFFARCTKCGGEVPVEEELVRNALLVGGSLPEMEHSDCTSPDPEPAAPLRRYRIQFLLYEMPDGKDDLQGIDPTGGIGHTVEAASFADAVNGPMSAWLYETWERYKMDAPWADVPSSTG